MESLNVFLYSNVLLVQTNIPLAGTLQYIIGTVLCQRESRQMGLVVATNQGRNHKSC